MMLRIPTLIVISRVSNEGVFQRWEFSAVYPTFISPQADLTVPHYNTNYLLELTKSQQSLSRPNLRDLASWLQCLLALLSTQ